LTTIASAKAPTKLKIAGILMTGPEQAWDGTFLKAWEEVKAEKPHGLEINKPIFTEGVWNDTADTVASLYARKGFDIIWMHGSYSDQVKKLQKKYPDILFVVSGSGNEGLGGNQYWAYIRQHESTYLQGMVAGLMTKTNKIGMVGTFPADDVWDAVNGFFLGAKSVIKGDITKKITFIESWFDPPKAREASNAQISAGVDQIYMDATAFEACEKAGIFAHGKYKNWIPVSPKAVMTSSILNWKPSIKWIIDEWYKVKTTGQPYNGNTKPKWFSMAEGAGDVVLNDRLPQHIKDKVLKAKADILSGKLVVPVIVGPVKSD
jgi:basic membrane protein A and related proteins